MNREIINLTLGAIKQHTILCILCFISIASQAQKTKTLKGEKQDLSTSNIIELGDRFEEIIIDYPGLEIFIDSTKSKNFDYIRKNEDRESLFKNFPDFKNQDYNSSYTYWVRLKFKITSAEKRLWLAEFYDQSIDYITAYVPNENGDFIKQEYGDAYLYKQREFAHKNFHVILPSHGDVETVYFKIESGNFADIRIAVRTTNRFVFYSLNEYFLYGIFYGMILIICLYNILMFSAIREVKYIYYTFYLLCVAIYAMCIDGIAFQYLWPNSPKWNQYAAAVFLYFVIIGAILFSRKFLRTETKLPWHDRVLKAFLILRSIYFIAVLVEGRYLLDTRFIEVLPLGFIFYTGVVTYLRGYRPARFFITAYGILFLGFFVKALIYVNLIPFTILTYYTLHISFLLEMLFLTFALADRVRILKNNRDRAYRRIIRQFEVNADLKDRVNKELEEMVNERTKQLNENYKELEKANFKLIKQSEEINQINSILDLDNWKLKNNLKEVLKDRVFPKKISYDEFKKIFPNDISCQKYLHDLKWSKGFTCKKCGNDRYSSGSKKFSLRCTKCGYDESPTTNTIFKGLRFPINKAFYILYTIMNQDTHFTLDELSGKLDLRRNTVWSFQKKVKETIKNHENKGSSDNEWQSIMLDFGQKIQS
ncbi:MAG: transposase [Cyclobacteriaceae bacterium]|nr:transposase [Cyclobacteriaceae bacterium]MCH8516952.1 transposase [Cyclobacteriaceae bacterium]